METFDMIKNFLLEENKFSKAVVFFTASALLFIILSAIKSTLRIRLRKAAKNNKKIRRLTSFIAEIHYMFILAVSVEIASNLITLSKTEKLIITTFVIASVFFEIASVTGRSLNLIFSKIRHGQKHKSSETFFNIIIIVSKTAIYSAGLILILSNLGFKVSTLVTSLGITSIAVAFAFQNILSDLFSSFTIYIDKPFVLNDFIKFDDVSGTIVKIGIRSTRISSLTGEEIILSNNQLTNKTVRNFTKLKKRRALLNHSVCYETQITKLENIPLQIKKIIESHKDTEFSRSNLKELSEYSIIFETEYFVTSPDYAYFMNINEKINLEIMKYFKSSKIEFAYPTQNININK
ncbi:MAG: mechanosensitive ion channel family protein [Spirochaetes bacterium]|nr:mechanosensitive ion channel family protein [Spirochaetota bacterium]